MGTPKSSKIRPFQHGNPPDVFCEDPHPMNHPYSSIVGVMTTSHSNFRAQRQPASHLERRTSEAARCTWHRFEVLSWPADGTSCPQIMVTWWFHWANCQLWFLSRISWTATCNQRKSEWLWDCNMFVKKFASKSQMSFWLEHVAWMSTISKRLKMHSWTL